MLTLRDFYHLPALDPLIGQMTAERSGLLVIAGLDPRPDAGTDGAAFLPSGRHGLFGIVLDQILTARPDIKKAIVVTKVRHLVRPLREFRRRVEIDLLDPGAGYAERIAAAARRRSGLVVVDRLTGETIGPALGAARGGALVLAQLDTILRGPEAARQLQSMAAESQDIDGLRWVLAVQRFPALCPICKQPAGPAQEILDRFQALAIHDGSPVDPGVFMHSPGCPRCRHTGRSGEVSAFDVFRLPTSTEFTPSPSAEFTLSRAEGLSAAGDELPPSLLPMETYLRELVRTGYLPIDDGLDFERGQVRRTFNLFTDRERVLVETQAALEGRLLQLEAAHKVLEQRTEALVSLQTIGQAMIASQNLEDLAGRLCRHAVQLCDAQRAILYTQRFEGQVEIIAAEGWEPGLVGRQVEMSLILDARIGPEPQPFDYPPPGVPILFENFRIRAGMAVSLFAENEWVGLMIVHTSRKPAFQPGETALLKTFANQAALAMQRAGLVEQLRDKVARLEAAQVELARKERMEQEMELARTVQQDLLPKSFPVIPGYRFAARCEPARQVGGDFYDVVRFDDGRIGVAIGDVSDKGVPAALYMATTRSLLRTEARRERSPATVLNCVHDLLRELAGPGMFVTLFYGVLDPETRTLAYARAGHDYPYLSHGGRLERLQAFGTPLGLLEAPLFRLEEAQVALSPGDRLVLYTDGITDVFDADGRPFGRDRLEGLLRTCCALPVQELTDSIFAAISHYCGEEEPFDDRTILMVEVG
jgi:serine phosphatase RsbU (regulator of sigma subunit)